MRWLISLAVVTLSIALATSADAHHGFSGRYDRSKPLWVAGNITQATYNQPHALINIEPAAPAPPPADLLSLSADAYQRLGGRDVVTRSQPIAVSGPGILTLLLNPVMTSDVGVRGSPPARGQDVGAIVYRECSTGELRVQLLRMSASDVVVRDSARQREVDGCDEPSPTPIVAPTVVVAVSARPEPVVIAAKERADTASAVLLAAAALVAGGAAFGVGLLLARRSR